MDRFLSSIKAGSGLMIFYLLFGGTANYHAWNFTLGYQKAGGRSSNRITRLLRSDDFLFRAGYSLLKKSFVIQSSVLFIQRLGNSSVANSAYPVGPEFIELPQSAPAQLNLLVKGEYMLSNRYLLNTSVAFPFLQRKTNVDGLTRAITLSFGMNFSF